MDKSPITVQTTVKAPLERVWQCWTEPEHINGWAFASDDWQADAELNDLKAGGKFKTAMSAKDGSGGFDFTGTYTQVTEHELIEYDIDDGRHVRIIFEDTPQGILITQTFDPESVNPIDHQRSGWQGFLDNFKRHVESHE